MDEDSIRQFKLKDNAESSIYEKIKIKNKKSSQSEKRNVILSKNLKPNTIMEQEILKQVTETLEAQASSKKL